MKLENRLKCVLASRKVFAEEMVNLMREIAETPPDPAVKDIALQAAETLIEAGVAQIECGRVILAHEGKIIERTPPDLN